MDFPFLKDVIIIFGLSIGILFVCLRLKIPTLVGLLLTGLLCGPHGFGAINAVHEVELLAELGVVLLLFSIGIELSLRRFLETIKEVVFAGGLQVAGVMVVGILVGLTLQRGLSEAIFLGCILSLSSTAIVLKLLQDRSEVTAPYGRLSLSMLIFQDIIVVPMMLLVPVLAGGNGESESSIWVVLGEAVAILVGVAVAGQYLIPQILHQVARTNSRKLFLLTVLFICFSVAWITAEFGLSLAIGAFLSGLIISESEYHHHALGNIFTLQEVFTSFFFISTGMLLDVDFVLQYPVIIACAVVAVMALKASVAGGVAFMLGLPLRTAVLTGCALCQVGEFSFILIKAGMQQGISSPFHYQLFLAVTLCTMALTPFVIMAAPSLVSWLQKLPIPPRMKYGLHPELEAPSPHKKDHVIIVGFGRAGKNLAHSLKAVGVPYVILEINPELVREEKAKGEPIFFGDATHEEVLNHVEVRHARIIAVLVNDPLAAHRVISVSHHVNPKAYLIVRARRVREIERMTELGATEVVPDEFESSIEIFTRVLKKYLVPREEVGALVEELRKDQYERLRDPSSEPIILSDLGLHLLNMSVDTVRLHKESPYCGMKLMDADLRHRFYVSVLLIKRDEEVVWKIGPDTIFQAGDVVVLFGQQVQVRKVMEQMSTGGK